LPALFYFLIADTKLRGCGIHFKPSYGRFNHVKTVYLFVEVLPGRSFSKIY